jgi:hypothetical protein
MKVVPLCWYLLTQIEYEYRYLYFTIGKQWSKDLLSNKGISISQHTSIARARGKCNDRNLCIMTLKGYITKIM